MEKVWVKTSQMGDMPAILVKRGKKMSRVRYEKGFKELGYCAVKGEERTVANKKIKPRS